MEPPRADIGCFQYGRFVATCALRCPNRKRFQSNLLAISMLILNRFRGNLAAILQSTQRKFCCDLKLPRLRFSIFCDLGILACVPYRGPTTSSWFPPGQRSRDAMVRCWATMRFCCVVGCFCSCVCFLLCVGYDDNLDVSVQTG